MADNPIAIVVLAAGHGTRMKSDLPKVLHEVGGLSMLGHVLKVGAALNPTRVCVVTGDHAPQVGDAAKTLWPQAEIAVQSPPQGTGHAVSCAMPSLEGFSGTVFVLYADTPLLTAATLQAMQNEILAGAGICVLGFTPPDPLLYGRLIRNADGGLDRIVEARDASPEELAVGLCNSGVMAIRADVLNAQLPQIGNQNAKGEYYLTDIVGLARAAGVRCAVVEGDEREVLGVDSRNMLAEAEAIFQDRCRQAVMAEGVTLLDPQTVYFSHDTELGRDVTVGQQVVFAPGVAIGDGAQIKAFSHLEGASVAAGAVVGPYARLRPGAAVGARAKIGNFVEIKKAEIAEGAKVNHLSYVGDAFVGAGANIGAGTITCNYDGFEKFRTEIGAGAFVGSNSSLVAPVSIGDGAYVGSGSVITKDVEADALAVARGRQIAKSGWALSFRNKKSD